MVHLLHPHETNIIYLDARAVAQIVADIQAWDAPTDWDHERQTYNADADPCTGGCHDTGWILQDDECYTPCTVCNPEAAS